MRILPRSGPSEPSGGDGRCASSTQKAHFSQRGECLPGLRKTCRVSRFLSSHGLKVIVANPRKVRAIYESERKSDARDAEMLARLGRMDVKLLHPSYRLGGQSGLAGAESLNGLRPLTPRHGDSNGTISRRVRQFTDPRERLGTKGREIFERVIWSVAARCFSRPFFSICGR